MGVKKTRELVTDIRDYNNRRVYDIKSSLAFIFLERRWDGRCVSRRSAAVYNIFKCKSAVSHVSRRRMETRKINSENNNIRLC